MPDQPDDAAHSDEHRPATEPASAAGDRGESNPSDAVQLLKQILGRLQRMEGGLSQHEEWLRRIEQEHRQAAGSAAVGEAESAGPRADEGELKRLIGALTLERDRAAKALAEAQRQLGQYQQELTALRRQSADAHSRLAERDKQLAALKEAADGDRQQTASLQSDLSRQLQQRHEQLHAAQQRLAGLEQQAAAREKQVVDLQAALDQAATKFEALSAELTVRAAEGMRDAAQAGQVWPRFARYAVAAALVAAFASAGLTAWLYHRSAAGAVQRISAIVTAPGIAPEVLNQCATAAIQNRNDLQATVDPRAGTLELRLDTPQVSPGVAAVDAAARAIVARLAGAASVAASQPAGQPEVRSLAARIAETDKQISAATRPVPGAVAGEDAARLPERWQALHEERGKAIAALAEIQARTEPKPVSADAANVTAELIAKAEAADAQFQT
ncbi:MAG: hypothetical protein HY718_20075, partial [Planctomycetes bacterium]|nr:hypothetical protein [Planctomycetota bacterium]